MKEPWEDRYNALVREIQDVTDGRVGLPMSREAAMRYFFKVAWIDGWGCGIQRADILNRNPKATIRELSGSETR